MQVILHLFFSNLNVVIQILFLLVLGLISVYFFRNIREDSDSTSSMNSSHVEGLLRKVLEVGPMTSTAGAGAVASGEFDTEPPRSSKLSATAVPAAAKNQQKPIDEAAANEQISLQLSQELQDKERKVKELEVEIEALKSQAKVGGGPDMRAFEARIKDLEEKLSEYEVIEDDIANLSIYKEENARLKDELRATKRVASGAVEDQMTVVADGSKPQKEVSAQAIDTTPLAQTTQALSEDSSESIAPTPAAEVADTTASSPLDVEVDPDKMLSEVNEFSDQPGRAKKLESGGPDEAAQLLQEFESFVKKG